MHESPRVEDAQNEKLRPGSGGDRESSNALTSSGDLGMMTVLARLLLNVHMSREKYSRYCVKIK